ncbi:hypothetical protein SJAG_01743 [Schizosaccharomyces japonicus yFS275]|uniref:Uncharacterized protein n=1 Tax=Schizosaccharomyces japonicus (strain yFS275 / FY16936) TaxID=402676 RepID=B6JYS5_SCHJY|nr:hypothetical protein SJAG_01743 [Schizosaccharomyces japonicus yFS275]EEB06693.1 hypothetical protein SJAG_01743 [Schizosaccharomyces japonicus yFS275]
MAFRYFQLAKRDAINVLDPAVRPNHAGVIPAPVFGLDSHLSPHVGILLPLNGFDMEQVCFVWRSLTDSGFMVEFIIPHVPHENDDSANLTPQPNQDVLSGTKGLLKGPPKSAKEIYSVLCTLNEFTHPNVLHSTGFTLTKFDVLFITGGAGQGVEEMITDPLLHSLLVPYLRLCYREKPDNNAAKEPSKIVCAVSQGVRAIYAADPTIQLKATTIPVWMERSSLLLGLRPIKAPYTAPSLPQDRYVAGPVAKKKFIYVDEKYYCVTGRCNNDSIMLARMVVRLYKQAQRELQRHLRHQSVSKKTESPSSD